MIEKVNFEENNKKKKRSSLLKKPLSEDYNSHSTIGPFLQGRDAQFGRKWDRSFNVAQYFFLKNWPIMEAAITPLDLCAPSILCPRVQSPSTPSMHFQFIFEL